MRILKRVKNYCQKLPYVGSLLENRFSPCAVSNASKKDLQTLPKLFAEAEIASQDLVYPIPLNGKFDAQGTENLVKLAEKKLPEKMKNSASQHFCNY